jgi:hypothetical protein
MSLQGAARVTEDEVILTHLLSERKTELTAKFKTQDLQDTQQNKIRRELLNETRGGIYQVLSTTAGRIDWYKGTIDSATFANLKIVPSFDWVEISGGTLSLFETAKRFDNPDDAIFKKHSHHLEAVIKYEKNLEEFEINLILISTHLNRDFTIIDGVHHAVAAGLRYFVRSPKSTIAPISAYLGVCENPTIWHAP